MKNRDIIEILIKDLGLRIEKDVDRIYFGIDIDNSEIPIYRKMIDIDEYTYRKIKKRLQEIRDS